MIGIVLDAGALIALERNDRSIWAALKLAVAQGSDVIVPSTALAQVWRGTGAQAQLAKALQFCVIATFDPVARNVGELCGRSRTNDICDAHVALIASRHGEFLYTSDVPDMRRLLATCGDRRPAIVRC
jgi:predicted nucleic acid-binding protein